MTATGGSASAVNALVAMPAARATLGDKRTEAGHPSFDAELTEAQRPAATSTATAVSQRHAEQHPQPDQRGNAQQHERDVPQHATLRGKGGGGDTAGSRVTLGASRNRVPRQPLTASDPTAAEQTAAAALKAPAVTPLPTPAAQGSAPAAVTGPTSPATAVADPHPTDASPADASPAGRTGEPVAATTPAASSDAPSAPAITALVAGNPSTDVAPDRQQPTPDAAATAAPAGAQLGASLPTSPAAPPVPAVPPSSDGQAQGPVQPVPAPSQQTQPDPSTAAQAPAGTSSVAAQTGQHHATAASSLPAPAQGGTQPAVTVTATPDRETSDQGPAQQGHDQAPTSHGRASVEGPSSGGPATPYSTVTAATSATSAAAAAPQAEARTAAETPATQALPAGTLAQVAGADHSVRVQLETLTLGKVTADMHSRPGEIGVHLSVPDDAGRALMAQRLDALRDSLGQGGTAVHLSLAAQGNDSQGQQSTTPREDRAPAPSAPQPHDAATPRAMDGSSVTPSPVDGNRLVDVHA